MAKISGGYQPSLPDGRQALEYLARSLSFSFEIRQSTHVSQLYLFLVKCIV